MEKIIEHFRELSEIYDLTGDSRRSEAYRKAVYSIESAQVNQGFLQVDEIKKLPRIGKSMKADIDELIERNGTTRMQELLNGNKIFITSMREFKTIHGIGNVAAKKLFDAGMRTIEDLKKNTHLLNDVQKASIQNLKHDNKKIPRQTIARIETFFRNAWKDKVHFEIVGSYRRGKDFCGDIDFLIRDMPLDRCLKPFIEKGIISCYGFGKNKFLGILHSKSGETLRVDFLTVTSEQYYFALLYFTGSRQFNVAMRSFAKLRGYKLNEYGLFKEDSAESVKVQSEKEIFEILGYEYREPSKR